MPETKNPTSLDYKNSLLLSQKEAAWQTMHDEILAQVPEGEPQHGQILEVLDRIVTFRGSKAVISPKLSSDIKPQDRVGDWHAGVDLRLTEVDDRDLSKDPKFIEKYGQEAIRKANQIIQDYTGSHVSRNRPA